MKVLTRKWTIYLDLCQVREEDINDVVCRKWFNPKSSNHHYT